MCVRMLVEGSWDAIRDAAAWALFAPVCVAVGRVVGLVCKQGQFGRFWF